MSLLLTDASARPPTEDATAIAVMRPTKGKSRDQIAWLVKDPKRGAPGFSADAGSSWHVLPEMREGQRDVLMVAGPSGCGKSTFASQYARDFQEWFASGKKKPRVLIVNRDDPKDDRAFDGVDFVHIDPAELAVEPLELEDIMDPKMPTLCIFDDCEALTDKKMQKALEDFSQACLERGRKKGIYVLHVSHRPAAGRATRVILQEQTGVWLPTQHSGAGNTKYMLEKHLNVPGELRTIFRKHADEFGHWVVLRTDSCPRLMISPKKVSILDEDELDSELKKAKVQARARAAHEAREEIRGETLPAEDTERAPSSLRERLTNGFRQAPPEAAGPRRRVGGR